MPDNHFGMVEIPLTDAARLCIDQDRSQGGQDEALNAFIFYAYTCLRKIIGMDNIQIISRKPGLPVCSKVIAKDRLTNLASIEVQQEPMLDKNQRTFKVTRETLAAVRWTCEHYGISRISAYNTLVVFGATAELIRETNSDAVPTDRHVREKFQLPDDFHRQLERHILP